jgi:arylsulfotransferase ASST
MLRRWTLGGLLFLLAWVAAPDHRTFAQPSCPPARSGNAQQFEVRPRPDNATLADATLTLASAAPAFLEYGNAGSWLRTPTSPAASEHRFALLRLQADSSYEVRAFALDQSGCPAFLASASLSTDSLPEALRGATIQSSGQPSFPLLFMDWPSLAPFLPPNAPGDRSRYLAAVDAAGRVVWYYRLPKDLPIPPPEASAYPLIRLANGHLLYLAGYYGMEEITPDGQLVRRLRSEDPAAARAHHEVLELPDGHLLYLGAEDRRSSDPAAPPLRGDTLHEIDPVTQDLGHLLDPVHGAGRRIWNAFDSLDPDQRPAIWSGWSIQGSVDWTHANAMTLGPPGSVLISLRHLDQIISVSLATGQIEWKLGGTDSTFSFPDPDDVFHGQHSLTRLANGHLLIFDNGNFRPGGEYSRALELELNLEQHTARRVWQYRPQPDIFSDKISNVVRLPNGNTVVQFGWREAPDEPSLIQEVTPSGEVVWQQSTRWRGIRAARFRVYPTDSIGGEHAFPPTPISPP